MERGGVGGDLDTGDNGDDDDGERGRKGESEGLVTTF